MQMAIRKLSELLDEGIVYAQQQFRSRLCSRAAVSCLETFGGLAETAAALFPSRLEQGVFLALACSAGPEGLTAEEVFRLIGSSGEP